MRQAGRAEDWLKATPASARQYPIEAPPAEEFIELSEPSSSHLTGHSAHLEVLLAEFAAPRLQDLPHLSQFHLPFLRV
jgi:hypothetical protein